MCSDKDGFVIYLDVCSHPPTFLIYACPLSCTLIQENLSSLSLFSLLLPCWSGQDLFFYFSIDIFCWLGLTPASLFICSLYPSFWEKVFAFHSSTCDL